MINREIMIVENTTDQKLEAYSDRNSKMRDLKERKSPYIYLLVSSVVVIFLGMLKKARIRTQFFSKTFISYRPLENKGLVWIAVGIILMIYSIMNLARINSLIDKTDSERV